MKEARDFFNSKSFVVVGASRNKNKIGNIIFRNLLNSKVKVFGVNPKIEQLLNQKVYKDVYSVPSSIDCAIIATPKETVPLLLRQIGEKKIPFAIIISSGFGETNNDKLEQRILQIAKEESIRLLGPNCFGYVNSELGVNTTFFEGEIKKGNIGFISQSGAISAALMDKIGKFSKLITLGNAIDIGFSETLKYLIEDKQTSVICMYIESLTAREGQKFIEIAKKSSKPIIALKSGKTRAGQKAASTHTSALATDSKIYSGIFQQSKIIECTSISEMFQIALVVTRYPNIQNDFVILTNAGGFGVLTSDYCEKSNLNLTNLSKNTLTNLSKVLPENWSKNNPIDIMGDADSERYRNVLDILAKDSSVKNLIVILTPQYMAEPAKTAKIISEVRKPIFSCFIGGEKLGKALEIFRHNQIINTNEPEKLCTILERIIHKQLSE